MVGPVPCTLHKKEIKQCYNGKRTCLVVLLFSALPLSPFYFLSSLYWRWPFAVPLAGCAKSLSGKHKIKEKNRCILFISLIRTFWYPPCYISCFLLEQQEEPKRGIDATLLYIPFSFVTRKRHRASYRTFLLLFTYVKCVFMLWSNK